MIVFFTVSILQYHRGSNKFIHFIINAIRLLPEIPGWNCYIGTAHLLVIMLIIRIALEKSNDDTIIRLWFFFVVVLCIVAEMRHIWHYDLISFVTCALINFFTFAACVINK